MKTEIKALIDVPDGFEFDRIDVQTKDGDYYLDCDKATQHHILHITPVVLIRKKKPQTKWARMYKYRCCAGIGVGLCERQIVGDDSCDDGFIEWVGDWQEYTV